MPRLFAFITLSAALALATAASARPAAAPAPPAAPVIDREAAYQTLLAQDQIAAPNVDWLALRLAFADRPGFAVFSQSQAKREMRMAMDKSDCATALPAAKTVIGEAYVDAEAHMVAAFCEDAAGNAVTAAQERAIGVGLLKSIETGDGLSPEGAFTVITVDEEYSLMRALGLKVTSQSLLRANGHSYDALVAANDKGVVATYYFLIDRVLAAEADALRPASVSEGGPPSRTP
ncbi:MAG TPA: DUF4919 domain-containing protein [Caulobacteraceae bacterium]|jgi:hypothetical protein|nr:DUF4919 domain-containing protein [Caulobacteraceae bacterium]